MSPAAQTPDSVSPRRSKGSSRRAAARGGRSRGASRASLLGRLVIALVLIAAGVGVAWWTVQSTDRSQVEVPAETSAQSTTLPLFERVSVSGRVGATPTIEIKAPLEVDGTKATTIVERQRSRHYRRVACSRCDYGIRWSERTDTVRIGTSPAEPRNRRHGRDR